MEILEVFTGSEYGEMRYTIEGTLYTVTYNGDEYDHFYSLWGSEFIPVDPDHGPMAQFLLSGFMDS